MTLNPKLQNWKDTGKYLSIPPLGHQIFYREFGNASAPPEKTILLLHGFPESSYSYHKVIPHLRTTFDRLIVFDFLGFGLSDKPSGNYANSLIEQADIALQVWQKLGITGGHLLSHDMGVSVATELAYRHVTGLLPAWFNSGFKSFTFTNGSMVLRFAKLRITQKILLSRWGFLMSKLMSYGTFTHQVKSAHGNLNLSAEDLQLLWDNILIKEGRNKSYLTIKYLNDRKKFEGYRWLPALQQLTLPIHICWGEDDAVARLEIPRYLKEHICPQAQLSTMPGVGHFGQLGNPDKWAEHINRFYKGLGI